MADDRAKVIALVEKLRELDEKRDAILSELAMIAAGGESIGDKLRRVRLHFLAEWKTRYQSNYVWHFTNGDAAVKRLIVKEKIDPGVVMERITRFVQSDDPFYIQRRHPFELFVRDVNALVGLPLQHLDPSAETRDRLQGLRGE